MDAIKTAAEAMFEAKTWDSFIALITEIVKVIFGFVAKEEEFDYPTAE